MVTVAGSCGDDIKKDSVEKSLILGHNLVYLGAEHIKIGCVEAKAVIAWLVKRSYVAVLLMNDMILVLDRVFFIKARGEIDLCSHPKLAADLELSAEQIKIKMRMLLVRR